MCIVSWFFDILFPPRQTEVLLRDITALPFSLTEYKNTICLSSFRNPLITAAITENKYHHNRHAAVLLSTILNEWLKNQTEHIVFIPIPLSKQRQRERGHNQVTSVLRHLSSNYQSAQILETVLVRQKETRPQTSLKKTERAENVSNAFAVPNPTLLIKNTPYTLVLIDDVITTGATLESAYTTLIPHLPASSRCIKLALAH